MAKKQAKTEISFDDKLLLFKYFLSLLGKDSFIKLSDELKDDELLGYDENNNTYFYTEIAHRYIKYGKLNAEKLKMYDENICRHVKSISEKREEGFTLKYFQYIGLLFTEIYLDKYFDNKTEFINELNVFVVEQNTKIVGLDATPYTEDSLNKLCFMCATGSGKTLVMHINILQFIHYFEKAKKRNPSISYNKIILLTPSEGLSKQHLKEFKLSGISASMFTKGITSEELVKIIQIIDINKLREESIDKTVSVEEFEGNNVVFVDEGHKGLSGNVWYDYRNRLSADGFSFEYSATFKQAIKSTKGKEFNQLANEYGKSIIMDYSYKYFYNDGYGKEYRIYNLKENISDEQEKLYLTGCILSFYQQLKVYSNNKIAFTEYFVEKPLLIFVGNRVTASTTASELSDVEKVLQFINAFTHDKEETVSSIKAVLLNTTGVVNKFGAEIFWNNLNYIADKFKNSYEDLFYDILKVLFNSTNQGRLYVTGMKLVSGEIALKIGKDGDVFGVISVGDTAALLKKCEEKGIVTETNEFDNVSFFEQINTKTSPINILIGSRKFTEGWNSWRVSTMGLINFARGEGSTAIQLFGRGVRLRGYKGCLKRSKALKDKIEVPKHLRYLETLTIFGIKADYMTAFKEFLENEDMSSNENIFEIKLPTISRYEEVKNKGLKVLRLKENVNFKKQGQRLVLCKPNDDFEQYIIKNKVVVDWYSKVQSLASVMDSSDRLFQKLEDKLVGISLLDYSRIYLELQRFKNEKSFYNVSIDINLLKSILEDKEWYKLYISPSQNKIKDFENIQDLTEVAIALLKGYLEKFYKFHKAKWESPYMEYRELTKDNNFVDEYTISYNLDEELNDRFKTFIEELSSLLTKDKQISNYNSNWNTFNAFDFRNHLYAPLISVKGNEMKIEVSPVSLVESEKTFVDLLDEYCKDNTRQKKYKELYLLRNKSKTGIGFFEIGGFYPDFIMWLITADKKQYISFIDPKGILHLAKQENNPKIMFYKKIKEMEARLSDESNDIILNSFILSISTKKEVKINYKDPNCIDELESKNVLFLEEELNCIDKMMDRILDL